MYISYQWLSDFLDLSQVPAASLADRMSRTGIEVEGVENYGADLSNLVIGQVTDCQPHPDSDHLNVTQVTVGPDTTYQIVCGAPNVHTGAKVIVALVGAVLPGDFKIKPAKLRGVASNGMLCSLQELGFKDAVVPKKYADGLFLLPDDAPVGQSVIDYLDLDDPILELSITPNRADALSMRGVVYEVGAIIDQKPSLAQDELKDLVEGTLLDQVSVSIPNPDLSQSYQARVIADVQVSESPLWLQMRLMKAGIRPINNIVDITNYCLLLFGQPMHAFDYDKLPSKDIMVAQAAQGQSLTTLDGVERTLSADDIVILAGTTPVALAGVMGGLDTEVTQETRNVLLETAVFDRQAVRKTSNKFNLRSESSARFEKGINLATIDESGEFAAALMAKLAGGQVQAGVKAVSSIDARDKVLKLDKTLIKERLGIEVSDAELAKIFDRLDFGYQDGGQSFTLSVPPRRWDIQIEADVLEEIARIYGYDRLPTTLPSVPSTPGKLNPKQALVRSSRTLAEGMGFNQVISYVLTSPKAAELIRTQAPLVTLAMPMSEDRSVLRQSLFPALLEIARYNHARQNKGLAFYEIGKVFFGQAEQAQPIEADRFGILVSGQKQPKTWQAAEENYSFFDLKGILEGYFAALGLTDRVTYVADGNLAVMHPGRTARVYLDGKDIGFLGQVHPTLTSDYDLARDTYFAELDFEAILASPRPLTVQAPIPKYPSTSRDLALLVDRSLAQVSLVDTIKANAGSYLVSVDLFDRFVSDKIGADKQSLAYRLTFQDPHQTLTDDQVNAAMDQVTSALKSIPGLEIR